MEILINSNPEGKKYILTNHTCQVEGHTLYRIRALKDFAGVRAGELGGYVEQEHNLSQYGNCWICNNAIVYDYAQAKDNAKLKDACYVHGYVKLSGDCDISGCANLAGNVQIRKKGKISGNAVLTGNICVTENAKINGDVILSGDTIVKGNSHISTQIEANKIIKPCSLNEISKENSL